MHIDCVKLTLPRPVLLPLASASARIITARWPFNTVCYLIKLVLREKSPFIQANIKDQR
jgi:hypothetical protein